MRLPIILVSLQIFISLFSSAQSHTEDWENYFSTANGYPVSVNVDLGLQALAPLKERSYLIILRTSYQTHLKSGFPDVEQMASLDSIENVLAATLQKSNGSIFAGRFTQRGIREFYFYCIDTIQYAATLNKTMKTFAHFPWLAKAIQDKTWSNYFEVLFPQAEELDKIENRRTLLELQKKGDPLTASRAISHLFYFKTIEARTNFLQTLTIPGCIISEQPTKPEGTSSMAYKLVLIINDIPKIEKIHATTAEFRRLVIKNAGIYQGWQTYVVR